MEQVSSWTLRSWLSLVRWRTLTSTPKNLPKRFEVPIKDEGPEVPQDWRSKFRKLEQLNDGDPIMVIDQVLIEGTTMIGALSAAGKTWVALSMAKAITNGKPFLGRFEVKEPRNVLYLIPEAGDRVFRRRAQWMGINSERFLCRTQNDSTTLSLGDAALLAACKEWNPVIFLIMPVRFSMAKDENSASENAVGLGTAIGELVKAGAMAVVGLHHSAKGTREHEELFLETALRGSGDIGAMADRVWSIQWDNGGPNLRPGTEAKKQFEAESRRLFRLWLKCVKPREMKPEPKPIIRLQGRSEEGLSYLSSEGDFRVLDMADLPDSPGARINKLLEEDSETFKSLAC